MRLGDFDELKKYAIPCETHNGALTELCVPLYQIDNAPTIIWCGKNSDGLPLMDLRPRPHGEWKHIIEEDNDVECPFCGFQEDGIYYNFCPSCGADMRGEK